MPPTQRSSNSRAKVARKKPGRSREEDIDELRSLGFSEADIFSIILAAAGRCFFSKVLDATGTLPDAALRDMPDQLRVCPDRGPGHRAAGLRPAALTGIES